MSRSHIDKGDYGYRDKKKRQRILVIILLFISILVQLAIRNFTSMSAFRILFTVTAILTVLPLGTIAAPLLASWKYKTPEISFYNEVHPYEEKFLILYDLILTTKEQVIPLDAVIVHPIGVFAYCPYKKVDDKKAEAGLNDLFTASRSDPKIHIINDPKAFFRRLESLKPASEYEDEREVEAEAQLIKGFCM